MTISLNGTTGITGQPAIYENITSSATAATGTINYDLITQSILYYTANASSNWAVNIRGDATNTLNSLLAVDQAASIIFLVTQGASSYYPTSLTIDGSSVTPKWQGAIAPTSGNANGIDAYSYSILKTGNAAYTVLATQSRFA